MLSAFKSIGPIEDKIEARARAFKISVLVKK